MSFNIILYPFLFLLVSCGLKGYPTKPEGSELPSIQKEHEYKAGLDQKKKKKSKKK